MIDMQTIIYRQKGGFVYDLSNAKRFASLFTFTLGK